MRAIPLLIFCLAVAADASAKNLENRVGVGVALPDFNSLGSLSLRYHPSPFFAVQGLLGFTTQEGVNATIVGGKIQRNAYLEENMNFYVGVGGMILADRAGSSLVKTGIELDAL